jgi:N-acetylglucosaminyl-diphospho-decaprenol L-rhamnosyltransferase
MDLSIVIVNWNSASYVEECVASVETYTTGIQYEVIVVDNDSETGEVERLMRSCPRSTIINSGDNLGFARGNNLGFRHSIGEYVLFLNPDTKLIGPAINDMLNTIRTMNNVGILGCRLLNSDLSVQLTSIQRFPTIMNQALDAEYLLLRWPRSSLWGIAPLFSESSVPVRVDVISGACMLLHRRVFESVGMFSEDYFMYAEDLDLNYKVKRAGLSNYYLGRAAIIHHGGRSSSLQDGQWTTIMKHNAMRRLFRKMRGRTYEWTYRIVMCCAAVCRLLILGAMFPFGDKDSLRYSVSKWRTIFEWTMGFHEAVIKDRPAA